MAGVAVFCGARSGARQGFADAAAALGTAIAERGHLLVYGGSRIGLMGIVADSALAAGGDVIGVIPHHLMDREIAHDGLTELIVVDSMHARKLAMAEHAGGFVAMAGGFGTLDEAFEAMTWNQIGLHDKPVGFLNTGGYFDTLFEFFRQQVAMGFVSGDDCERLIVEREAAPLLDRLGV